MINFQGYVVSFIFISLRLLITAHDTSRIHLCLYIIQLLLYMSLSSLELSYSTDNYNYISCVLNN